MTVPPRPESFPRRQRIVAFCAAAGVMLSLGMSFAAVPLYRVFCQATGFGGTTQRAEAAPTRLGQRSLAVRFDGNVAPGLPWSFAPDTPQVTLRTGDTATVYFTVTNRSDRATVGEAQFNVTPDVAGLYFVKIACFCFSQQTLKPHETAEWPVVFYLDPKLEADETMARIDTLTLSYTFFAPKNVVKPLAAAESAKAEPRL